jgi:NADPH-dependent 2,4-dienoyl-CoA reductase/sulfur reductase-like enzyme
MHRVCKEQEMTHYVIVGNGVAGLRAVEVIRKRDGEGKITLLFAGGDAARAFDPYQGKAALHYGWQSAWEQGAIAGANRAGADLTYPGRITSLSMQIWGWDFQMLGEGNAQGPGYRAMTGDYPQMGIYKKLRDC